MAACFAIGLIILTPTFITIFGLPTSESFPELWILGPNHTAENYPFNITTNNVQKIYLGAGNHLGSSAYYMINVKIRNQSDPLPKSGVVTGSIVPPVFEYRFIITNGAVWEKELSFSFQDISFEANVSKISKLVLDDNVFSIDKVAAWNQTAHVFYFELFFELWFYNVTESSFQYSNRFVGIPMNTTVGA
jgi:hypothetical protein